MAMMRSIPLMVVILALVLGAGWWLGSQQAGTQRLTQLAKPDHGAPPAPALNEAEAAVSRALPALRGETPPSLPAAPAGDDVFARIKALTASGAADPAALDATLDDAALSDAQKATLRRVIEVNGNDPELLRAALDAARRVMK